MAKKTRTNTFEKDFGRLEQISNLLEDENIGLEDAIKLFEEGIDLSKKCLAKINEAELKITELKKKIDSVNVNNDLFDQEDGEN